MDISLGIITYKDLRNLPHLLASIESQKLRSSHLKEVMIVSVKEDSAAICKIASRFKTLKIKTLYEEKRRGKYSAVNVFLKQARSEILVLCSGDVLIESKALESLCLAFEDETVGVVASRPMPYGKPKDALAHASAIIWELNHAISRKNPKFGELVGFRNLGFTIPKTSVDEEIIACIVRSRKYRTVYCEKAVVYNNGPRTFADYIAQRRRIYCGHLRLMHDQRYKVSTLDNIRIARYLLYNLGDLKIFKLHHLALAIIIEAAARLLGYIDFITRKDHSSWKIIEKAPLASGVPRNTVNVEKHNRIVQRVKKN